MTSKYLFLSFLLLFSCASISPEARFSNERHKITHEVLKTFVKAMEAKGLHAAGIGEGIDHSSGKQNCLEVIFDIDELPSIEFARQIVVETVREFLSFINSKKGIQNYLVEYPFSLHLIHISIINLGNDKGLFSVCTSDEELRYLINNPENPMKALIEIHREFFEDAVRILAQQEIKDSKTYAMQNH